jgi:addiction module RelE/StbE family toxin
MKTLVWSTAFLRTTKRLIKRRPELRGRVERVLQLLAEDSFNRELKTHKLKGGFSGVWACALDYDYRILFQFVQNAESGEEEILLLAVGTHDEVY